MIGTRGDCPLTVIQPSHVAGDFQELRGWILSQGRWLSRAGARIEHMSLVPHPVFFPQVIPHLFLVLGQDFGTFECVYMCAHVYVSLQTKLLFFTGNLLVLAIDYPCF